MDHVCGGRLPGARRRRGLRLPLPPGAVQPRLPRVPCRHSIARYPGRCLPDARAVPVRQTHPVPAPQLPPLGRKGARRDRPSGRGGGCVYGGGDTRRRWSERVVVGSFGLLFLLALGKGFLHVRAGRVAMHREWMGRAFAIALAIATTRLISIPALLIVG